MSIFVPFLDYYSIHYYMYLLYSEVYIRNFLVVIDNTKLFVYIHIKLFTICARFDL